MKLRQETDIDYDCTLAHVMYAGVSPSRGEPESGKDCPELRQESCPSPARPMPFEEAMRATGGGVIPPHSLMEAIKNSNDGWSGLRFLHNSRSR